MMNSYDLVHPPNHAVQLGRNCLTDFFSAGYHLPCGDKPAGYMLKCYNQHLPRTLSCCAKIGGKEIE